MFPCSSKKANRKNWRHGITHLEPEVVLRNCYWVNISIYLGCFRDLGKGRMKEGWQGNRLGINSGALDALQTAKWTCRAFVCVMIWLLASLSSGIPKNICRLKFIMRPFLLYWCCFVSLVGRVISYYWWFWLGSGTLLRATIEFLFFSNFWTEVMVA